MIRLRILLAITVAMLSGAATADNYRTPQYQVTITNITKGTQFTPILFATHRPSIEFFELGASASPGLALLAEDGAQSLLIEELAATGRVIDTANSADVLDPPPLLSAGQSVTVTIEGKHRRSRLSLAAMILPTNDSFVALDSVRLPSYGTRTYFARGYDAGSEPNDEWCANIPGPRCGGAGASPEAGGEGFVHVANGVHGIGDLDAALYDWRNPVAKVVIKRIR